MANKRKDSNGRVLEKGESQREDGSYMYRWTDLTKKRQTIYASTLNELRKKELEVTKTEKISGISWEKGRMTVRELMEMHRKINRAKITTKKKYEYFDSLMDKIGISDVPIKDIRTSVAKAYMIRVSELGYSYGTVQNLKATLSPAFQMAVEDDLIIKNPFLFKLCSVIDDDRKQRVSISKETEKKYLEYVKNHGWFVHAYPDIAILLQTGMRVSELYGLTFKDLDFRNRRISVNKQLHWIDGQYMVLPPKSKAGNRVIAMTEEVRQLLAQKFSETRPSTEYVIDGHSNFVFINHLGKPKTRKNLQMSMYNIRKKREEEGLHDFSEITPHVLRHTFCSRMIEAGMDVKTLQIIMGHSDVGTTLNVYTHIEPEDAAKTMETTLCRLASNA